MNYFFKNVNIYLPQKINFSKKNLGKLNIFYKNFWIFFEKLFQIFTFYDIL